MSKRGFSRNITKNADDKIMFFPFSYDIFLQGDHGRTSLYFIVPMTCDDSNGKVNDKGLE